MTEDHPGTLSPPVPEHHALDDPGAHELEQDSDDQFHDAKSETRSRSHSRPVSPIPITRVERVDHEASYGEVPGTDAYEMRAEDARPDEVAFIDDEKKTESPGVMSPATPGGQPIPKTVLEEVPPSPVLGGLSRSSTHKHKRHMSDAMPDLVLQVEDHGDVTPPAKSPATLTPQASISAAHGHSSTDPTGSPTNRDSSPSIETTPNDKPDEVEQSVEDAAAQSDGFGDDFDDFEEGDEDAEFGDFDNAGFQEAETAPVEAPVHSLPQVLPAFPVLDFSDLDSTEAVKEATLPYLDALFPLDEIDTSILPAATSETPLFLTQRSASLWSQLVAPPALQPPNWIRSRIRRLFLVSLGVPVDLDEILPASKQKKLVLPSINLSSGRNSSDIRAVGSVDRLKAEGSNTSNTSVDSQGKPRERSSRRKGPPPPPELDLVYARQLCSITDEAMSGLTIKELKAHVQQLESMEGTAKEVLEYWTKRTDEKLGDREAFEGVIENLVQHARKIRK